MDAAEQAALRAGDAVTNMPYFPVQDGSLVPDRPELSYTELKFEVVGIPAR